MSSQRSIGKPFIELPTVESTNNYAMGLAREGMAQDGMAVFAHEQTRGRGQRNREWISHKDQNIALSLILRPGQHWTSQPFLLSMAVAVSVCRFCRELTKESFKVKWPNDVYWGDRKAAGILIENLWQGAEWKSAVVGIGINVNQEDFGDLRARAVSLKQITGREMEPVRLARELCLVLDSVLNELEADPQPVVREYRSELYKKNEVVRFRKENRNFEAIVKDVTISGDLVIHHATEEKYGVGEIEWI